MFRPENIITLIEGNLSNNGYNELLSSVKFYINIFNWQKSSLIEGSISNSPRWSEDDIMELTHQFLEWALIKGKFKNIYKVPDNYISYYVTQVLISFIAEKTKKYQNEKGLSYAVCKKIVSDLIKSDFEQKNYKGTKYIFNKDFNYKDILSTDEIKDKYKYVSKIPLTPSIKHYKSHVKTAIEDIINFIDSPVEEKLLASLVFELFDQTSFKTDTADLYDTLSTIENLDSNKFKNAVNSILKDLSKTDAKLLNIYLFQSHRDLSLSELSTEFNIPKSTLHLKIKSFKENIFQSYIPEDENDGINFLKYLSSELDKMTK